MQMAERVLLNLLCGCFFVEKMECGTFGLVRYLCIDEMTDQNKKFMIDCLDDV